MFGQIKENILTDLSLSTNSDNDIKTKTINLIRLMKESNDIQEFYKIYDMVEESVFENAAIAKEFLDECLSALSKLDKNELKKLTTLTENHKVKLSERIELLDDIVFNSKLNIKERLDKKSILIKSLTSKKTKVNYKEMLQSLDKKVNSEVSKMTNDQKNALNVFLENDQSKISTYYLDLIEEVIHKVDSLVMKVTDLSEGKKIIETKKRLVEMRSQVPTIAMVESILSLKESISE